MFSWNPDFLNQTILKVFKATGAKLIKFDSSERSNGYPAIWFSVGLCPFVLLLQGFKEDDWRIISLCLYYSFYDPKDPYFKLTLSGLVSRMDLVRVAVLPTPPPSVLSGSHPTEILASARSVEKALLSSLSNAEILTEHPSPMTFLHGK